MADIACTTLQSHESIGNKNRIRMCDEKKERAE